VLNPEGINCFRFFEGRGMLVWGARTISSDPEWKYVNIRRYFAYLERSIERGTQVGGVRAERRASLEQRSAHH
jgi:phage tail sheath protein FI